MQNRQESTKIMYLDWVSSFPKDVVQFIQDLDFDIKFEKYLFRSMSESYLSQILFYEKRFISLINLPLQSSIISLKNPAVILFNTKVARPKSSSSSQPSPSSPPRIMVARFSSLALPTAIDDLPHNYAQRIK